MRVREPAEFWTHANCDYDWADPADSADGAAGVPSAAGAGGVAGDGSLEDGKASVGASVGPGTASASAFSADRFGCSPTGVMAAAETDVCIYGANCYAMKSNVSNIVNNAGDNP